MMKNLAVLMLIIFISAPARSWGDVPEVPPPTRVDSDESSEEPSDYDEEAAQEWRWEQERQREAARQAAREEAARRAAERKEAQRQAALERDIARQEAKRQAAARRAAQQAETARVAAERQAEAERKRAEEESRRTGFGPHIRTIHVPVPQISDASYQRSPEIRSNVRPVIALSPGAFVVIGTIGKTVKDVPQKLAEVVLTYLGRRAGAANSEDYLTILSINKDISDDAVSQMQEAVSLIGRNFPEPATSDFLASSSNRGLRVLVSSMSSVPGDGIVLSPLDEDELEKEGRNLWGWVARR